MTENEAIKHLKLCIRSRMFISNNDVLDIAIKSLEKQIKLKEILSKRDNAFDGQEFGASYSDLDNIIEEIREVINS